jgi:hypothetical protein
MGLGVIGQGAVLLTLNDIVTAAPLDVTNQVTDPEPGAPTAIGQFDEAVLGALYSG